MLMALVHHNHKKLVKKALAEAKKLEKIPEPKSKEITKVYKQGLEHAHELQRLLKSEWFVKDVDKPNKKKKK